MSTQGHGQGQPGDPGQGGGRPGPEWAGGRLAPTPARRRPSARELALYLRRHWLATILALVILLVLGIRFLRKPAAESDEETPAVVTAQVGAAQVGDFAITIDALGTVEPRPGAFAQVAAPAASRVAKIMVATGDRVRPGQALVHLDESVWALQAQQARVTLDAAEKAFERADRLFKEGIAPRKDVETAATELAKARADLEAARRTLALATLRSPIEGVVTELHASLAQPVDVNQPLVEVVNPAGLEVLFHLSPADASRLAPGGAVELTAPGEGGAAGAAASGVAGAGGSASPSASSPPAAGAAAPDAGASAAAVGSAAASGTRQFLGRGTITGVSAAVDSATGAVVVRATVASPVVPLKAGQTVAGHLVVGHRRAVIVPVSALVPSGDSVQVFVVDAKGIAHATPVRVGERNDQSAEIVAGLRGGETIVTSGAYGVTDSARVEVPGVGPAARAAK